MSQDTQDTSQKKVSMQAVKQLRQQTGARIMDCKQALEEAAGDPEQAQEIIQKKYLQRAEKKQDRATEAGYIASYAHNTGTVAALVEVQCETDFVAKNKQFRAMARNLAMQVTAMNPADKQELLAQDFIKDPDMTVETYFKSVSGKIGENMSLTRFVRYELGQAEDK
jgi:elongation factor Ts